MNGWHHRGYLPHLQVRGILQSITFRLNDALPKDALKKLRKSLQDLPEDKYDHAYRIRIEAFMDTGMGCCALGHPAVAAIMQNALHKFDMERYRLKAWCIMPNHVHVLIEVGEKKTIGQIVNSWKSYTGKWALANNAELELGIPGKSFWMRDYWDRFIRSEVHYRKVVDYIHENPVKAGLCSRAEDWVWSSAGMRKR